MTPAIFPLQHLRNSDFILGVPRDVPSTKGVILEIVALLNDAVSARRSRTLAECESSHTATSAPAASPNRSNDCARR